MRRSYRMIHVMESDVNPHTIGKTVGRKIVCNISHSYNSIIIQR